MIPKQHEGLIDYGKIFEAEDQYNAAVARFTKANSELEDARRTYEAAHDASEHAVNGEGRVSALEAEHSLNAAEIALSVAKKVQQAAEKAKEKAFAWKPIAEGLAHVPIYIQAARDCVAAAAKADTARKLIEEAKAEHTAALKACAECYQKHVPHPGGSGPQHPLGSEADELAIWRGRGVDPISGQFPWNPQPL